MISASQDMLLDLYLGAALSASNDLVTTLCEPMENLSEDECRVLLLLWVSDGISEPDLAGRAHAAHIEPTLDGLERSGLVVREASGEPSVWLTGKGRGMLTLSTDEMGSRLRRLQNELVALRDVLQRTVGMLAEDGIGSGSVLAVA